MLCLKSSGRRLGKAQQATIMEAVLISLIGVSVAMQAAIFVPYVVNSIRAARRRRKWRKQQRRAAQAAQQYPTAPPNVPPQSKVVYVVADE